MASDWEELCDTMGLGTGPGAIDLFLNKLAADQKAEEEERKHDYYTPDGNVSDYDYALCDDPDECADCDDECEGNSEEDGEH